MSTVIEKVIIPLLILICVGILIYNPMQFDLLLRFIAGGVVIVLLVLLAFWLNRQNQKSSQNASPYLNPPTPPTRVDTDISSILRLFHTHAAVQMTNLLNPYNDKLVKFSGTVVNVLPPGRWDKQMLIYLTPDGSTSFSRVTFRKEWNSYFHTIEKGINIIVAAKIDSVDSTGVNFKDASIIP
jgi:hypothetical protein